MSVRVPGVMRLPAIAAALSALAIETPARSASDTRIETTSPFVLSPGSSVGDMLVAWSGAGGPSVDGADSATTPLELTNEARVPAGRGTSVVEKLLLLKGYALRETETKLELVPNELEVMEETAGMPLRAPDSSFPARISRQEGSKEDAWFGLYSNLLGHLHLAEGGRGEEVGTAHALESARAYRDARRFVAVDAGSLIEPFVADPERTVEVAGTAFDFLARLGEATGMSFVVTGVEPSALEERVDPEELPIDQAVAALDRWLSVHELLLLTLHVDPWIQVVVPRTECQVLFELAPNLAFEDTPRVAGVSSSLLVRTWVPSEGATALATSLRGAISDSRSERAIAVPVPRADHSVRARALEREAALARDRRDVAREAMVVGELEALEREESEKSFIGLHLNGPARFVIRYVYYLRPDLIVPTEPVAETSEELALEDGASVGELLSAWRAAGGPVVERSTTGDLEGATNGLVAPVRVPAGRGSSFVHALVAARGGAFSLRAGRLVALDREADRDVIRNPAGNGAWGAPGRDIATLRSTLLEGSRIDTRTAVLAMRGLMSGWMSVAAVPPNQLIASGLGASVREYDWVLRQIDAEELLLPDFQVPSGERLQLPESSSARHTAARIAAALGVAIVLDRKTALAPPSPEARRIEADDVFGFFDDWLHAQGLLLGKLHDDPPLYVVQSPSKTQPLGRIPVPFEQLGALSEFDTLLVMTVVHRAGGDAPQVATALRDEFAESYEAIKGSTFDRLVIAGTARGASEVKERIRDLDAAPLATSLRAGTPK